MGFHDGDDGHEVKFAVTKEDRAEFPELELAREIRISENDQGFVSTVLVFTWAPKS